MKSRANHVKILVISLSKDVYKIMRYHNITTDDMLNGDGLRTVLWIAGCEYHCPGCQNPLTWDPEDGLEFDIYAKTELFSKLYPDYISGITFSGGDPLHPSNREDVLKLSKEIKEKLPEKNYLVVYRLFMGRYLVVSGYRICGCRGGRTVCRGAERYYLSLGREHQSACHRCKEKFGERRCCFMEALALGVGKIYERRHTIAAGVVLKTCVRVSEDLGWGYLLDLGTGGQEYIDKKECEDEFKEVGK